MSLIEFELPEEFQGETYESILAKMLEKVPNQYDKLEGGFAHDMIAPSALEAAELIQFWLALGIKTNFHMWATGTWLDYHAHDCGLTRKPATCAYTDLNITTTAAVTFPSGFIFSVPSEDGNPAIEFETLGENIFDAAGTYTIRVKAVTAGKNSNVAADTIIMMKNPVKNVEAITNPAQVTGGTEAESDSSLRQRIDDFYAGHGASYVGNKADYERWAREVAGVGYAHCIPLYDGANSVKLIIADENGDPATNELCAAVETYIFGENHHDIYRLAPIGVAKYAVVAPSTIEITLAMNAKISVSQSLAKKNIVAALTTYFKTLSDEDNFFGELRYSKVAAILSGVAGLDDFKNLLIRGGTENISFTQDQMPAISAGSITLNGW